MSPRKLIAARDPHGFRPLVLGKLYNSYVFASETCALDALGAQFVRDVEPGEVIVIEESDSESSGLSTPALPVPAPVTEDGYPGGSDA